MIVYAEILAGLVIGCVCILFIGRFNRARQLSLFSAALVIAAAIYGAFSAVGVFAGSASLNWLATELVGIPAFAIFAYFGRMDRPWLVALGWLLHMGWDFFLHGGPGSGFVPAHYPGACAGFDLVFAAYIAYYFYFQKNR